MPRSVTIEAPKPKPRKKRAEHHTELLMGLANQHGSSPVDDADAYSIEEFCRRHRLSVQLFYKLKDEMPPTFSVGKRRLISREAAARWRAEREAVGDALLLSSK
jgi:hypothetical protein